MDIDARSLHDAAIIAQEAGDFTRALGLEFQAMIAYQQSGDKKGFAEIQAMMFLTYRHLYERNGDESYLMLAKHAAMVGVELAEKSSDTTALAVPLLNLARAQEMLGEYLEASGSFDAALEEIETHPPTTHNKEAVKLDFAIHALTAKMRLGDLTLEQVVLDCINELKKAKGATDYERGVWLSGGYMRLATVFKDRDEAKVHEYLSYAKEVIDADTNLELRRVQWEKLVRKLVGNTSITQKSKSANQHKS